MMLRLIPITARVWLSNCRKFHVEKRGTKDAPYFVASEYNNGRIGNIVKSMARSIEEARQACENKISNFQLKN